MKVGIDCRLPTYQMGGISQYTIHLIQALGKLFGGNQFKVFHSRKEKRNFSPSGKGNISRSDLFTPCHHRFERYTLGLELVPHRLDVFHSPDFIPPSCGASRRIITVHDLNFIYYPEFLTSESRRYYADQIGWAVESADHIIADSDATRLDLINLLGVPPQKVTTIYLAANPIFSGTYSPDEIAETMKITGAGYGFILTVGTLEPRKNLPVLFRAYKRLRDEFEITVPLVLVGSKGWLFDEIYKTITDLELEKYIIHLSGLQDVQLAHLYRAASVLAFPSHYEGFGLPALEAMLSGCPVVVSNRGSLPEVVGAGGVLLEPDDVDAWTITMYSVMSDVELSGSMRIAGKEQAKKFTWEKTAVATNAVYEGTRQADG